MVAPILVIKNIEHEGAGLLTDVAEERGFILDVIDLEKGDEPRFVESYSAVVVCGGPDSANDDTEKMKKEIEFVRDVISNGVPYFGICLGFQILAKAAGGKVIPAQPKEIGFKDPQGEQFHIELTDAGQRDALFQGCGSSVDVFQLHGETIELADGIALLGTSQGCHHQVIKVGPVAYGMQAHVEVSSEMFDQWLRLDPDLKRGNHQELIEQFEAMYDGYLTTAHTLFNNFLDIIEQYVR